MNGATPYEIGMIGHIRAMVERNQIGLAQRAAADFVGANKTRRIFRRALCRTVKGLHKATPINLYQ